MTALLIASAMVLDFGLVRLDRQVDKSAADSAVGAGLASLASSGDGNGKSHPYVGVCTALRFLRAGDPRFSGVSSSSGTWTDGNGAPSANGCTDPTLQAQACSSTDQSTWARFSWQNSATAPTLQVQIQSGYQLTPSSGWREDTLSAAQSDQDDLAGGCNQLAVIVTQARKPGLGSIARSADLVTSIRSVGRVVTSPGGNAPAMLLLKRTGCTSLEVGSTAGSSWVHVFGMMTSGGLSQPGTIHADANGLSCSSSVFYGKANSGIVAYAAPLSSGLPDPTKPGIITSVAGLTGLATAYDDSSHVYSSSDVSGTGGGQAPTGRGLVTRKPLDDRYLSAVRSAMSTAQSSVFASGVTAANATNPPYNFTASATCPSSGPNKGVLTSLPPGLNATSSLFIECPQLLGSVSIDAGTVVLHGSIAPSNSSTVQMPNAHHLYIYGTGGHAIDLTSSGSAFRMHTVSAVAGHCTTTEAPGNKAVMVIKDGDINESAGGSLQLCNTAVLIMGSRDDGCLPTAYADLAHAPAPTQTPCNGGMGTGQVKQTGGNVDWTAPNVLSATIDANGDPTPAALTAWGDASGPEDLALWDESAGNSSSTKYQFTGGGAINLRGIFMVPNADPISLSGNANFDLYNAQFVATSLALASNNTTLSMRVDPNSAVTLPTLKTIGLVR